jgi:uncharacterized protein YggE
MSMSNQDNKNNGSRNRSKYYMFAGLGVIAMLTVALALSTPLIQGRESISIAKAQQSSNNDNITREISVTGIASKIIKPDKAVLNIGVETQAKTIAEAASMNSDIMNKVVSALNALGVDKDKISTNYYSIYPVYEQKQREDIACIQIYPPPPECIAQVLVGYKAVNSLTITVNADADIGRIIDSSIAAGANQFYGVSFYVSQEMQNSIVNELIEQAAIDAKNKAERALTPLGEKVGNVKSISIGYSPIPIYSRVLSPAEQSSTPIFPEQQQVSVSVYVTFLIE